MGYFNNLCVFDLDGEIWRDIAESPDMYEVSNFARVRRKYRFYYGGVGHGWRTKQPQIITQHLHKSGYVQCAISINGKFICKKVHRIVASAFIDNGNNYPQVNHIDGDKTNNLPSNLEWVTGMQNTVHAKNMGLLIKSEKTKRCMTGKTKPVVQMDLNMNVLAEYGSIKEASMISGISDKSIYMYLYGIVKSPKKYLWRYK